MDHVIPHKGDYNLFTKLDNHIPLCTRHHNFVTGKFDAKFVVGGDNREKIKWLNSQRLPTDSWTPKRVKVLKRYDDEVND